MDTAVFDNDSIHRNLHMRHRNCVPAVELQRRLRLINIPTQLIHRRLSWVSTMSRGRANQGRMLAHNDSPLAKTSRRPTEATTLKEDMKPLPRLRVFGFARWRKDWAKISNELTQERRIWGVRFRHVDNLIGDAGSTHPVLFQLLIKTLCC